MIVAMVGRAIFVWPYNQAFRMGIEAVRAPIEQLLVEKES